MSDSVDSRAQRRERWIQSRLEEDWSDMELQRGKRYQRWREYVIVGVIWTVLILPAPLGFLLIAYGVYLRIRYRNLGKEYIHARIELKREFNRRHRRDVVDE